MESQKRSAIRLAAAAASKCLGRKGGKVKALNLYRLIRQLEMAEGAVEFCRQHNLLPQTVQCLTCGSELDKLYAISRRSTKTVDFRFQCNRKSCKNGGRNQVQLRRGHLVCRIEAVLPQESALGILLPQENGLSARPSKRRPCLPPMPTPMKRGVLQTSSETVSDYYTYCREVCSFVVEQESAGEIGGPGFGGGDRRIQVWSPQIPSRQDGRRPVGLGWHMPADSPSVLGAGVEASRVESSFGISSKNGDRSHVSDR